MGRGVSELRERDREVCALLVRAARKSIRYRRGAEGLVLDLAESYWVRPSSLGGRSRSDHAYRLRKLVRHGYAARRPVYGLLCRLGSKRIAWEYRPTEAGRELERSITHG